MKLSKFVKRAKSESYCVVIHADDSGIWLGTRLALYNATELPYMEGKEQAGAVLDIDSKAWEKMFFDEKYTAHAGADFGMNLTETDPTEQEARRVPLEMFYKGIFKSITFDNGTEFAAAEGLERSCVNKRLPRTKVYFCHPYSSWERGTNENTNGMIRRRFPKGTNFAAVTNAQIAQAENWINNYPRKILGYKSSEIVFRECLLELGIAA